MKNNALSVSQCASLHVSLKNIQFILQTLIKRQNFYQPKHMLWVGKLLGLLLAGSNGLIHTSNLSIFRHWNQELASIAFEGDWTSKRGFKSIVTYQIESIQLVLNCLYTYQNPTNIKLLENHSSKETSL